jgi:hypothetical protein
MKIEIKYVPFGQIAWLHSRNYRKMATYLDKTDKAYALSGYAPPTSAEPSEGLVQSLANGWKHQIDAVHVELIDDETKKQAELQDAELAAYFASVSPELAERFKLSRSKGGYKYVANGCYRRSIAVVGAIAMRARRGNLDEYLVPIEIVTYANDADRSLKMLTENASKAEAVAPGSLDVYDCARRIFAAGGSAADCMAAGIKKGTSQKFQYANELANRYPALRLNERFRLPDSDPQHLTFSKFDHAFLGELRKPTAKDGSVIDETFVANAFTKRQTGEAKREKPMIEREKIVNLSANSPSTLVRDLCAGFKDGETTVAARIAELPAIGRLWDLLKLDPRHPMIDAIEKAHREAFPDQYAK